MLRPLRWVTLADPAGERRPTTRVATEGGAL